MAKKRETVFMCTECGNEFPSWQGQCSYCGAWNSIVEQKVSKAEKNDPRHHGTKRTKPVKLNEVGTAHYSRICSGIHEFDRVLGGGIVRGSLILISGEPGIGKSTLIIQSSNAVAKNGTVLYVSGEESEEQIRLRADRVCPDLSNSLYIYPETCMESVIDVCEEAKPVLLVVDSIQTMYSNALDTTAGSITQIRACSNLLMKYAKTNNVPVFIVCHVNKSGDLAGPKTIEHMVDCVLNFVGDRDRDLRILRSVKNRFGTTEEIGAFRMGTEGMKEVQDLSGSLLENGEECEEGSVVAAVYEGSRPVFFEIQALVVPANVGFARRTSIGIDHNRLNMILAVLEKKAGLSLVNCDVYVNVVGGMRPDSPATDLAVALAIFSSVKERKSKGKIVTIGEIGLTGNLRAVRNTDKIIAEAGRLGYKAILLPGKNTSEKKSASNSGLKIIEVHTVRDALKAFAEN